MKIPLIYQIKIGRWKSGETTGNPSKEVEEFLTHRRNEGGNGVFGGNQYPEIVTEGKIQPNSILWIKKEIYVHDVIITKEALNHRLE